MLIIGKEDVFGGVTVNTQLLDEMVKSNFAQHLELTLQNWISLKKKGIWFQVHIQVFVSTETDTPPPRRSIKNNVMSLDSKLIPVLVENGFIFHHAKKDYVMMTKWLARSMCTLPKYAHTNIGVGGLVVDGSGRILLMKEKKGFYRGWKYPGGLSDPNENIFGTAIREVREETGVHAVAEAVLLFRQMNRSQFHGVGDIYFVCVMKLADEAHSEVTPCPHETLDARWFTREEMAAFPEKEFHEFHHLVLERYDQWKSSERKGCHRIDSSHKYYIDASVDLFMVE